MEWKVCKISAIEQLSFAGDMGRVDIVLEYAIGSIRRIACSS